MYTKHIYSDRNISYFKQLLDDQDWSAIFDSNDPQVAYTHFHRTYTTVCNTAFPVKNIKLGYRTRKPWLSEELKKGIKFKNKLYYRHKMIHN